MDLYHHNGYFSSPLLSLLIWPSLFTMIPFPHHGPPLLAMVNSSHSVLLFSNASLSSQCLLLFTIIPSHNDQFSECSSFLIMVHSLHKVFLSSQYLPLFTMAPSPHNDLPSSQCLSAITMSTLFTMAFSPHHDPHLHHGTLFILWPLPFTKSPSPPSGTLSSQWFPPLIMVLFLH